MYNRFKICTSAMFTLVSVLIIFSLVSCSQGEINKTAAQLLGTWQRTSDSYNDIVPSYYDDGITYQWEFTDHRKGSITAPGISEQKFEYRVDEDGVMWVRIDPNVEFADASLEFVGDNIVILTFGTDDIIILERLVRK